MVCVKNLSPHASVAQLVALFSRFEGARDRPPLLYRLLTGRMKGQAFVTLPGECALAAVKSKVHCTVYLKCVFVFGNGDTETAQDALQLLHGYRLLGKPLVLEFGRERTEADQREART